jgi:hypothetical protein
MNTPATNERIQRLIHAINAYPGEMDAILSRALREQDKLTRHACAEAVSALPNPFGVIYATGGDRCKEHGFDVAQRAAHCACINASTV